MQYVGFIFGIFGLIAYVELSSLKARIAELERTLTRMEGTSYHEDRASLVRIMKEYTGREVKLELKEDQMDYDVINYGNTRHGSITILDVDEEWMFIRIDSPNGTKNKLLRTESVERVSLKEAVQ